MIFINLLEDYDGEKPLKSLDEKSSPETKKKAEKRKRNKLFPTPKPVKKVKFEEDFENKQIQEKKETLDTLENLAESVIKFNFISKYFQDA